MENRTSNERTTGTTGTTGTSGNTGITGTPEQQALQEQALEPEPQPRYRKQLKSTDRRFLTLQRMRRITSAIKFL